MASSFRLSNLKPTSFNGDTTDQMRLFQNLENLIASAVSICRLDGSVQCQIGGLITVIEELQRLLRQSFAEIKKLEENLSEQKDMFTNSLSHLQYQINEMATSSLANNIQESINGQMENNHGKTTVSDVEKLSIDANLGNGEDSNSESMSNHIVFVGDEEHNTFMFDAQSSHKVLSDEFQTTSNKHRECSDEMNGSNEHHVIVPEHETYDAQEHDSNEHRECSDEMNGGNEHHMIVPEHETYDAREYDSNEHKECSEEINGGDEHHTIVPEHETYDAREEYDSTANKYEQDGDKLESKNDQMQTDPECENSNESSQTGFIEEQPDVVMDTSTETAVPVPHDNEKPSDLNHSLNSDADNVFDVGNNSEETTIVVTQKTWSLRKRSNAKESEDETVAGRNSEKNRSTQNCSKSLRGHNVLSKPRIQDSRVQKKTSKTVVKATRSNTSSIASKAKKTLSKNVNPTKVKQSNRLSNQKGNTKQSKPITTRTDAQVNELKGKTTRSKATDAKYEQTRDKSTSPGWFDGSTKSTTDETPADEYINLDFILSANQLMSDLVMDVSREEGTMETESVIERRHIADLAKLYRLRVRMMSKEGPLPIAISKGRESSLPLTSDIERLLQTIAHKVVLTKSREFSRKYKFDGGDSRRGLALPSKKRKL